MELVNIDKEFGSGCCQILVKFLFEQFLSLGKHATAIAFVIWLFEKFHLTDFTWLQTHQFSFFFFFGLSSHNYIIRAKSLNPFTWLYTWQVIILAYFWDVHLHMWIQGTVTILPTHNPTGLPQTLALSHISSRTLYCSPRKKSSIFKKHPKPTLRTALSSFVAALY